MRSKSAPLADGQRRERAHRDGDGQHRISGLEHLPAVLIEDHGGLRPVPVRQHDNHQQCCVLGQQRRDAVQHQAATSPPDPGRNAKGGPQPDPPPPDRHEGGEYQRRDAHSSCRSRGSARLTPAGQRGCWPLCQFPPNGTKIRYAAITTRLEITGASAGAANRWCACKMPYSTTASPYNTICGANTASMFPVVATSGACTQCAPGIGRVKQAGHRTSRQRDSDADRRQD